MERFNQTQLKAITTTSRKTLVKAGAGSGKSTVLTARITYLLNQGVSAKSILAITFTRQACKDMKSKLIRMNRDQPEKADAVTVNTFHGFMYKVLKVSGIKEKVMIGDAAKENIMKHALKKHGCDDHFEPEEMLSRLSYLKNNGTSPWEVTPMNDEEANLLDVMKSFEELMVNKGLMDFDDLQSKCIEELRNNPSLLRRMLHRYEYLFIDEYQDVNFIQQQFISLFNDAIVYFTGDLRQAIYSFRGSSDRFIQEFNKSFPEATVLEMNENYRSTPKILSVANEISKELYNSPLIPTLSGGVPVRLIIMDDPMTEAKEIIKTLARVNEDDQRGHCILYRTHKAARYLLEELAFNTVPFQIKGNVDLPYFRKIPSILLSFLHLIVDSGDIQALLNVLPTLFISAKKAEPLLENNPESPIQYLVEKMDLNQGQRSNLETLSTLLSCVKDVEPKNAIEKIRKVFLDDYVIRSSGFLSKRSEAFMDELDEMCRVAVRFGSTVRFLSFVKFLKSNIEESDDDGVKLMSIHSAKGLEFDHVILIGAVEGILPHQNALEPSVEKNWSFSVCSEEAIKEERRLAYVAVTRARKSLAIYASRTDQGKQTEVSRFFRKLL